MNDESIDGHISLITSLYVQVEFLKGEILERNNTIDKLLYLLKNNQINYNNGVKNDPSTTINSTTSREDVEVDKHASYLTDIHNSTKRVKFMVRDELEIYDGFQL